MRGLLQNEISIDGQKSRAQPSTLTANAFTRAKQAPWQPRSPLIYNQSRCMRRLSFRYCFLRHLKRALPLLCLVSLAGQALQQNPTSIQISHFELVQLRLASNIDRLYLFHHPSSISPILQSPQSTCKVQQSSINSFRLDSVFRRLSVGVVMGEEARTAGLKSNMMKETTVTDVKQTEATVLVRVIPTTAAGLKNNKMKETTMTNVK